MDFTMQSWILPAVGCSSDFPFDRYLFSLFPFRVWVSLCAFVRGTGAVLKLFYMKSQHGDLEVNVFFGHTQTPACVLIDFKN